MTKRKVLLTGVTGFIGSHTTIQLLEKGYEVIGTMRNLKRATEIKSVIAQHTSNIDQLSFSEADLMDKDVWNDLMKDIDFVQHIASPFPRTLPKNDNELIIPAKNGTLNVLKAAAKNGIKRVVLTSSTGAIIYGKPKGQESGIFNENNWTDITNKKDSTPYFRSKTIAEQAAWDFIKQDNSVLELTTICPGAVLGPVLGPVLEKDFGTSANIVIKALDGSTPAVPKIGFDVVDVRSVAELHVLAMENPKAANERFVGSAGYLKFEDIATILRAAYPKRNVPRRTLPNFAVRLFANFETSLKPVLLDLGTERKVNNTKARRLLHWQPIDNKEAVLACAESVIQQGILR